MCVEVEEYEVRVSIGSQWRTGSSTISKRAHLRTSRTLLRSLKKQLAKGKVLHEFHIEAGLARPHIVSHGTVTSHDIRHIPMAT